MLEYSGSNLVKTIFIFVKNSRRFTKLGRQWETSPVKKSPQKNYKCEATLESSMTFEKEEENK